MDEAEWLSSHDPATMLEWLRDTGLEWATISGEARRRVNLCTDRKLRLFACACCRQVWHLLTDDAPCPEIAKRREGRLCGSNCPDCRGTDRINRSRRAVEVAERYADGEATNAELETARNSAPHTGWSWLSTLSSAQHAASNCAMGDNTCTPTTKAALLRDIFGNPFRPYRAHSERDLDYEWLTWNNGTVPKLAQGIYEDRAFDRMPILADALEEAGCEDKAILRHLRGQEFVDNRTLATQPPSGPHVPGCWVLDLLLGKG